MGVWPESSRAEVYWNDGPVNLVPRQPIQEAVVKGTMGVENEHSALALPPCEDVLSNQVLQKFRFPGARAAADVEMLVALGAGKSERGTPSGDLTENEVVAGRESHLESIVALAVDNCKVRLPTRYGRNKSW